MRVVAYLFAPLAFQLFLVDAAAFDSGKQAAAPGQAIPFPRMSDDWRAVLGPQESPEDYDASKRHEMTVSLSTLRVPSKAWRLYRKGLEDQKREDFEAALRDFEAALKVYPAFAVAFEARGTTLLWQMKLPEAQEAFLKALALDPQMFEAELGVGLVMNGTGQFQKAIEHLQKALHLNGECWQVRYALGRAHYGLGQNRKAELNLKLARAWQPNHPNLYLLLAFVLLDEDKPSEAIAEMETFLTVSPDDPLAAQIRSKINELRGTE
jgi:tetratricopeptide (TPR) repeat protein